MTGKPARVRCAVYTRKSHEEGLDQEFNSLDVQRQSSEAYIESQRHEGWQCLEKRYDAGGFSGGTKDRPALNDLLDDICAGRIDCAVVYKVDRLSQWLLDFSQLIALFDEHEVSFVSVMAEALNAEGIVTKKYRTKTGKDFGGTPWKGRAVYDLPTDQKYTGKIVHKDKAYPSEHVAIVKADLSRRCRKSFVPTKPTPTSTRSSVSPCSAACCGAANAAE